MSIYHGATNESRTILIIRSVKNPPNFPFFLKFFCTLKYLFIDFEVGYQLD